MCGAPARIGPIARIESAAPTRAARGTPYHYALLAVDPDGDPLQYALEAAPVGMQISAAGVVT
ncbi:MAG: hypothetical protein ACT4NL_13930, partial [Pseudomarimonas sp.]